MSTRPLPAPSVARREAGVDLGPVRGLVERITATWSPRQVWLFGSRARGDAHEQSDWDLLVVVPDDLEEAAFDPVVAWRLQKDAEVRADVVLCRASDFDEDRTTPNTLAYEAWHEGILLYER